MRYLIVVERTDNGFSAYSPDLPGCVAAAPTLEATEQEMAEVMAFHLEGLRAEGLEIPEPQASSSYVDVPA